MIIVFEGLDGSGKETQTKLIEKRLNDIGLKTIRIEFPNYCNKYSLFVKEYLNGDFGNNLNPYLISTFFGLDRFGVYKREMSGYIDEGYFILCDRYIYSNLIYQGSLIDNEDDRDKFFKWVLEFEYDICGLPKENMTFFMNLSLDINLDIKVEVLKQGIIQGEQGIEVFVLEKKKYTQVFDLKAWDFPLSILARG